jgi:hypothetical protein
VCQEVLGTALKRGEKYIIEMEGVGNMHLALSLTKPFVSRITLGTQP